MVTTTHGFSPAAEPGSAPLTPQTFPRQIQFRFNGVDLGGPDATIVDFVGDFDVSRAGGVITVALA